MDMLLGFLFILVIVAILGSVTGISIYFEKKKKKRKKREFDEMLVHVRERAQRERLAKERVEESWPVPVDEVSGFFGCKCRFIRKGKGCELLDAYDSELERGRKEGFLPVLVSVGFYKQMLESELDCGMTMAEQRQKAKSIIADVREEKILSAYLSEHMPDDAVVNGEGGDCDMAEEPEVDDLMQPASPGEAFIIAELPVERPEDIFAWIPVGGWNECPDLDVHVAFARHWYEKYGAIPASITEDTIEYVVRKPLDKIEAKRVACEQYAYSPDIVEQGTPLPCLADLLSRTRVWFFWWD